MLKRLAHRNPNVQLYTLTLAESLSKNCGIEVHREIASRAFTQALEKLVTDRVRTPVISSVCIPRLMMSGRPRTREYGAGC